MRGEWRVDGRVRVNSVWRTSREGEADAGGESYEDGKTWRTLWTSDINVAESRGCVECCSKSL